jgi:hypothetical protein
MTGDEFTKVASLLVQNTALGSPEARDRSAVSRAYYGGFHLVVEFLGELGVKVKQSHVGHHDAYVLLQRLKADEAMMASRLLDDLRTKRNYADYRLQDKFASHAAATHNVEMAIQIRDCLARCRQEPTHSEILAALAGGQS